MKAQTKTTWKKLTLIGALAALTLGAPYVAGADDRPTPKADKAESGSATDKRREIADAQATLEAFRKADPDLQKLIDGAAGYAVFPTVGKGAAGVGGAYGHGVLFESRAAVGSATLTQVTVGAQLGGQAYSEVVFFETHEAMQEFKKGQTALTAEVSAVAAKAGASANARFAQGVAVFTMAKGGLMAEASVGGQRFQFRAFPGTM